MNNHIPYFIPLTSPKDRIKNKNNTMDFTKIIENNRLLGCINFNNMIPVHIESPYLTKIDINSFINSPNQDDKKYGFLLLKEQIWLNTYEDDIQKKANKFYQRFQQDKLPPFIAKRTINFNTLEAVYEQYLESSCRKEFSL